MLFKAIIPGLAVMMVFGGGLSGRTWAQAPAWSKPFRREEPPPAPMAPAAAVAEPPKPEPPKPEIGRASCRERV